MARECGECTACCTMFPIGPIDKPMNTPCQYCNQGCTIYDTKPQMCTDYECAYLQSDAPESLRPDKCGIIFTKKTDRIFSGVLIPEVKITDVAKAQIHAFNEQGYSVVLLAMDKSPHIMPSKDRNAALVYKEYKEVIGGVSRY